MKKTKWIWITLAAVLVSLFALGFTALAAETEEAGDMNGDGILNSADAIYLLRHTIMPEKYPLSDTGCRTNAERLDTMQEALENVFDYEENVFVKSAQSTQNPSWNYTTSTFSGWGGSIGTPAEIDTIRFRVRAREEAITQIKVFLSENDKKGAVLYEEIIDVNIAPKTDAYVCWTLPEILENEEGKTLYFTYNCNAFCDVWSRMSADATVSPSEYQSVMTYATNGNFLDSPAKMTDVSGKPCRYLYVEFGTMKDVFVPKADEAKAINVFLPEQYELVVGDNFQLFYRGVVQAVNPYHYYIKIQCSRGNAYPRYFEWNPTAEDVGSHKLTLSVYDDNGNLLGTDKTQLIVKEAVAPTKAINVLCLGDSLTAGGYWPSEMNRRLSLTGGTPEGNGFENIRFVGTKKVNSNGTVTGHEGYGGWSWQTFCSEKSPFYDEESGDISFRKYCEKNGIDGIDAVYILLTWNGQATTFKTDYALDKGHFVYAQRLLDKLHEEYPDAIVCCMGIQMPSQNGGMGKNYGADGTGYSDAYGMLVTAMHYNAKLEEMCRLEKYTDFVKYVDVAGQFDTDYNMPSVQKPVNNRNQKTETMGSNGVHPSVSGYYQIADAAYRAFCHDIANHDRSEN